MSDLDTRAANEVRISVVLVAGLVIALLVMAYFVSALTDDLFDLLIDLSGQQLALMIVIVLPAMPLAIVVLFWARDRMLGTIACSVVCATALVPYVRGIIDTRLHDAGRLNEMPRYVEWSNWVIAIVLPVGAALAWGIARRQGSSWWPGLVAAAVAAALLYRLDVNPVASGDSALRPPALALQYRVLPAVLGGLACWWLEVRQRR